MLQKHFNPPFYTYSSQIKMKLLILATLAMALLLQMALGKRAASLRIRDKLAHTRNVITPDKRSLDVRQFPGLPDFPDVPGLPDFPGVPDLPDVPGLPDFPGVPDLPDVPGLPDFPGVPDLPDVPSLPDLEK